MEHGEQVPTILGYLGNAQFWFESFQNWQSEFLSTGVLVVLFNFLRSVNRRSPSRLLHLTLKLGHNRPVRHSADGQNAAERM